MTYFYYFLGNLSSFGAFTKERFRIIMQAYGLKSNKRIIFRESGSGLVPR